MAEMADRPAPPTAAELLAMAPAMGIDCGCGPTATVARDYYARLIAGFSAAERYLAASRFSYLSKSGRRPLQPQASAYGAQAC
jgi:hypothetical protein